MSHVTAEGDLYSRVTSKKQSYRAFHFHTLSVRLQLYVKVPTPLTLFRAHLKSARFYFSAFPLDWAWYASLFNFISTRKEQASWIVFLSCDGHYRSLNTIWFHTAWPNGQERRAHFVLPSILHSAAAINFEFLSVIKIRNPISVGFLGQCFQYDHSHHL